jgi:beta-lactamase class A
MSRRLSILCGALAFVLALTRLAGGVCAQDDPRAQALSRLLNETPIQAEWFAPSFLAQVPLPQIEEVIAAVKASGSLEEIGPADGGFTLQFSRAEVRTHITLDAAGRIVGLFFETPVARGQDLAALVQQIARLPGRTAVLVVSDGVRKAAHAADAPLAVGSAYKLAVLRAVAERVAAGDLAWSDVARLDPAWRSLPHGMLQDWPEETPLTIATLANLMISISDNTAADALLHIVGRQAVEVYAPHSRPLLSTREAFTLKAAPEALRQDWRGGDEAARRALLQQVASMPLPPVQDLPAAFTPDIEWSFTAAELCALLAATHSLPALTISPGLARPQDWQAIAYKGGSDFGVLNLSTYLVAEDGTRHCVVASWNDESALDESALALPYSGLLRALAEATVD